MDRVIEISRDELLAQRELNIHLPLVKEDYKRLQDRIPYIPLIGERFDDINWIYPLLIPNEPHSYVIGADSKVHSMLFRFNNSSVSVIGDDEMNTHYLQHPNHFIYGVGLLTEKVKNGKTYSNIRLRGWLLVKLKDRSVYESSRVIKKK